MATISLRNLTKLYPDTGRTVSAVEKLNLEIKDGEFMVLVGPSGCGKSTTLRMIAGLEEISDGTVSIGDRVVNEVAPKDRDIAMVFQNYALYPHMTVYENMAFGLRLKGFPSAAVDERIREAAGMLGLEPYLERKPKALSGGQRQRVAVGRAIVRKPRVFLFDEPLSNLDAKMRVSTRAEISKLHDRLGVTMVYVTHDQVEAMTMGDRICVMNAGRIMQVADPLELYNAPANMFVAGFIGTPPMNLIRGMVQYMDGQPIFTAGDSSGGIKLKLAGSLARRALEYVGRPLVLGLRPEHIYHATMEHGGRDATSTVEAVIEVAETLGAETNLYLAEGPCNFVARVEARSRFHAGERTRVIFDLEHAHLFDPQTENVIT